MGRPHSTKELVLQISDGILSTVTDMALALIYTLSEYSTTPRSKWGNIDYKVMQQLEHFDSRTIKRALSHLYHQGHIQNKNISVDEMPRITDKGIQKIRNRSPHRCE